MFAPFRLNRLLLIGLAACTVTWAMAASALALPLQSPPHEDSGARPAFKDVAGDVKEPETAARPDFKVVPGDVKAPESAGRPDFNPVIGDVKSDADRARAVAPVTSSAPVRVLVPGAVDDNTSTVALIISIAAILTALGAVTLTVTRPPRGLLRT